MSRNYRKEYDNYHSRPEQKIRRAARNAARRLFADADPDKDVHHKDNNPLNNDKNNLSLVTQHYNRREPRLRQEDVQEMSAMAEKRMRKRVAQAIQISGSAPNTFAVHQSADAMRKSTRAFQLHFQKQRSSTVKKIIAKVVNKMMDKKAIFFIWDAPFAKIITSFGEDMGTVTGTHIAGTGDDSSTVLVKKKKKQKKKLQIRFKLKNQKSLKKRIIDNVLAIQQKI
jgi:hypothetical protein